MELAKDFLGHRYGLRRFQREEQLEPRIPADAAEERKPRLVRTSSGEVRPSRVIIVNPKKATR